MSVVGAKVGTKNWSEAPQHEITKNAGQQFNSAQDMQKFDGQDLGDIANKIADPNYVDPLKRVRGVGSDKLDKDAFMKLMLAQMKNQDPTNPLKSHEMAAQLAQFSQLEQMSNVNTTLTEMQKSQKPMEGFQALNFIGKSVAGDSAKLTRLKGDKSHDFEFNLPADAKDVEIKLRNSSGEIVRKIALHDMKAGDNKWTWNGKNEAGSNAPVGEYQMVLEAKGSNGKKLAVKTDFSGLISGVSYSAEGPVLMVGTQTVKLKDVKKIMDPSVGLKERPSAGPKDQLGISPNHQGMGPVEGIQNNDQKMSAPIAPDLKTSGAASDNDDKGAEDAPAGPANMLTGVGMSSGMMDKFKQDVTNAIDPHAPNTVMKEETKASTKPTEHSKDEKALIGKHKSQG